MDPNKFVTDKVKDIPTTYLDQFPMQMVKSIWRDVLGRPKLSKKERNWFVGEVKTLIKNLRKIRVSNDAQQREAALRAIMSALAIGYYHAGGTQILRELEGAFRQKLIKPANWGRSRPDIDQIIDRHARDYRSNYPKYVGNNEGTAKRIYDDVYDEIDRLPDLPKNWVVENRKDPNEKKRAIARISKRMADMKESTIDIRQQVRPDD
jgi:hypothetical protein